MLIIFPSCVLLFPHFCKSENRSLFSRMKIKVKESSIICPNKDTPNEHLWVSNIDLLLAVGHIPILYFYKPIGSSNFFDVKLLKGALREVLLPFYPVAGRLGTDENGRIQINCNGEGVLFIEAESDSAMNDINDFTPTQQLLPLIPKVDYSMGISSYPLLLLQVTKFTCGGICLGIGWNHILADGAGLIHFLHSWANIARGLPITLLPCTDRTFLRHRIPPAPTLDHPEYLPLHNENAHPQPSSLTILKITTHQISLLKATIPNSTTFEILTAHTWRCACKARGLPHDQATQVYITVDGRSRLNPNAPPGYFGNLVLHVTASARSGDIVSEALVCTVERIHKAIKRVDDEYIRSAIDTLELKDKANFVKGQQQSRSPNLKIISWMGLAFSAIDFGWGKPVYLRASNPWEGKGHILYSPNNDGSLQLPICLETAHTQYFQKLFYELFSDNKCVNGISRM